MRKFYLDNVRWIIVLSVLPFHVFFVSNGLGTSDYDIRLFAPPQCHIIRLTNGK